MITIGDTKCENCDGKGWLPLGDILATTCLKCNGEGWYVAHEQKERETKVV